MIFVPTCDVKHSIVGRQRAVLPALALPVDHDLHDFSPQWDVGGIDGHAGGGAVTRLRVLTWDTHTRRDRISYIAIQYEMIRYNMTGCDIIREGMIWYNMLGNITSKGVLLH